MVNAYHSEMKIWSALIAGAYNIENEAQYLTQGDLCWITNLAT